MTRNVGHPKNIPLPGKGWLWMVYTAYMAMLGMVYCRLWADLPSGHDTGVSPQ